MLGQRAIVDVPTALIALVSLGVLWRVKLPEPLLVLAAGAAGRKVPWHLYERSGLRRLVARPVDGAVAPLPAPVGPLAPAAWWGEEAAAAA